jgi:RNA polymerase sigma factor (sigma-70 family)
MTEEQLIANLRKGRQSALSEIYDLYAQELLVFCFSYTKSKQDAEEVVQDAFLRLWEMRSSIRSDHSLKSLLFRIDKNRVIDLFRGNLKSKIFADYLVFQQSGSNRESEDMDYDGYRTLVEKVLKKLPPCSRMIPARTLLHLLQSRR